MTVGGYRVSAAQRGPCIVSISAFVECDARTAEERQITERAYQAAKEWQALKRHDLSPTVFSGKTCSIHIAHGGELVFEEGVSCVVLCRIPFQAGTFDPSAEARSAIEDFSEFLGERIGAASLTIRCGALETRLSKVRPESAAPEHSAT